VAGITPRQAGRHADPHAWQSLVHAQRYVENIRAALVQARPAAAPAVNARAADYTRRLAALDASIRERLAAVPAEERRVVTSHDAFGYFAEAYGLRFSAAQGWNTGSEASASDVAQLVRQLKAQRVRALFVENINDPRLIERIAQETGARVGGTLYSDALSAPGTPAATYLGMMSHNASTLLAALQPSAAPR
jgi:ABC-type Zn uptake system ZnuABC Zn-binding protein ZnuA